MNFRPISIQDKDVITAFTHKSDFNNCDFAFANMCSWSFFYDSEFAVADNFLFIRFYIEEKGHRHLAYMIPLSDGNGDGNAASDLHHAIEMLEQDAETMGFTPLILGLSYEKKEELNALFPAKFTFMADRDYFDYLYLRADLATLRGKKFQPKRNHINKFRKLYPYEYHPVTPALVPQCLEVERIWWKANMDDKDVEDLSHEQLSMTFALNHFEELGLTGGAITVYGKLVAFTYGSPVNDTVFGVHVEKADVFYEGIFSVINMEFASRVPEQYIYINREEDLGLPGLRQSKLSYNPTIILEKYAALRRR
ncbi:MAG: phosphatidylglycerol lysyltransferase domain-containing protein [Tannerella sp.]|jgi:hypothetical protein|nr:phosphatidylglycerol lysyltransferase domain-containing protein [Tannerella sp.]